MEEIKINLGSGRQVFNKYINIDIVQVHQADGKPLVDIVVDIEKEKLPYDDSTVSEILSDNVFEHLSELKFVLNECHRVLKPDGVLVGMVPVAGSTKDFKDPTHKRHFIKDTFSYFTGQSAVWPDRPGHPKYADYGFKPWVLVEDLVQEDDMIKFKMRPRK